ncbi:hypothetical protein KEJ23_02315 [Candidatus Bathyarchaeota archaeon]|nr:hypothetical protein [Candidatus Bathyarchaeota archaeon]
MREDYLRRKIVAPYLLLYEVENALRYSPDLGLDDVKSAIRDLLAMQIGFRMLDQKAGEDAVELTYKFGLTLYDINYYGVEQDRELPTLYR